MRKRMRVRECEMPDWCRLMLGAGGALTSIGMQGEDDVTARGSVVG